jgi:hypothetical protein
MAVIQQSIFKSTAAAQTQAFTPPVPSAGGHFLGFHVGYRSTTNNGLLVASVADTATGGSNTYLNAVTTNAGASKSQADIWYVDPLNSKGTAGVVTITFGGTDTFMCVITWYEADSVLTGPLDNVPTPTTITGGVLAQPSELVIAGTDWNSTAITETVAPASPWVNAAVQTVAAPNDSGRSSYQITSATTALTYSDTLSAGTALWHAVMASFKMGVTGAGYFSSVGKPGPRVSHRDGRSTSGGYCSWEDVRGVFRPHRRIWVPA